MICPWFHLYRAWVASHLDIIRYNAVQLIISHSVFVPTLLTLFDGGILFPFPLPHSIFPSHVLYMFWYFLCVVWKFCYALMVLLARICSYHPTAFFILFIYFIYLKYVLKFLPVPLFIAFSDFVHVQYVE